MISSVGTLDEALAVIGRVGDVILHFPVGYSEEAEEVRVWSRFGWARYTYTLPAGLIIDGGANRAMTGFNLTPAAVAQWGLVNGPILSNQVFPTGMGLTLGTCNLRESGFPRFVSYSNGGSFNKVVFVNASGTVVAGGNNYLDLAGTWRTSGEINSNSRAIGVAGEGFLIGQFSTVEWAVI
jgi:hypothetical protein